MRIARVSLRMAKQPCGVVVPEHDAHQVLSELLDVAEA